CGFIGSAFIRWALANTKATIVNLDALTYAAQPQALACVEGDGGYYFVKGDINNADLVSKLLEEHQPCALINFAAESHVDRSITAPMEFSRTNIQGTLTLLEACRSWLQVRAGSRPFRFLQVSTDEVYGDLGPKGAAAQEGDPWHPGSPYAASKAAADHLVDAWVHTYGFPALISHASNNYGPWQYPEKLIPRV
ncbi:dTDP-glucose 4,6-dehydratase, partial [Alcanivorax sp. HI0083]